MPGEQLLAAQQIEHVINNSRRAAQAGMSADKRDFLAPELFDANGDIGGVPRLVEPHGKILPSERADVTGARELLESRFDLRRVEGIALSETNVPAVVAIAETALAGEFEPAHDVGMRLANAQGDANGAFRGI